MVLEKDEEGGSCKELSIVKVFKEIETIRIRMIMWIIATTPSAVFSLIKAIGSQSNLGQMFANVGWLIAASVTGFVLHFILVHVCMLWFFTKRNPFSYLKFIVPAQTTAFASASSAATLPVTLECVKNQDWYQIALLTL